MATSRKVRDVKLVSIGNSKGVRIPKSLIQKYGLSDTLLLEETEEGLLIRQKHEDKLSWDETYKAMAEEQEHWGDFDDVVADGLEDWDHGS